MSGAESGDPGRPWRHSCHAPGTAGNGHLAHAPTGPGSVSYRTGASFPGARALGRAFELCGSAQEVSATPRTRVLVTHLRRIPAKPLKSVCWSASGRLFQTRRSCWRQKDAHLTASSSHDLLSFVLGCYSYATSAGRPSNRGLLERTASRGFSPKVRVSRHPIPRLGASRHEDGIPHLNFRVFYVHLLRNAFQS